MTTKNAVMCLMIAISLGSCNLNGQKSEQKIFRTIETENLLKSLKILPNKGVMFGHQETTVYGIRWDGDPGRSDVKSVCGDYPAVCGWEIGRIETGSSFSLDSVSFDRIRQEMIDNFLRGGVNTLSWHADNPLTGGDSWDVTAKDSVVSSILAGGKNHEKFINWLDVLVEFLTSLTTSDGTKVPVIFRPWHEHTGSWFWWGKDHCTPEEYKTLWTMTHDYLHSKGVNNIIYAYSPGGGCSVEDYMERYPGDDYVDLLGFDYYQLNGVQGTKSYIEVMNQTLSYLTSLGKEHKKPIAVTETGSEALPIKDWWTGVLNPILEKYPVSYVLVWRNAREKENHFYAPYPGQLSAPDFVKFYNHPRTLFCKDLNGLYN